jgi:hypothetical protein
MTTDCLGSLTMGHAVQDCGGRDGNASRTEDLIAQYTPREECGDEYLHSFVVAFVNKWISTCRPGCPHMPRHGPVTWPTLLETFAAPLATNFTLRWRRGILDRLWRTSQSDNIGGESDPHSSKRYWFAVMRAADFWDIPCLYWHMVYMTHERAHALQILGHHPLWP